MSDSIVTRDRKGNIIVKPMGTARKARPKRPAPTPAELGLKVTASDPAPAPAGPSAEDRAAIEQTEEMIRERRRAYFAHGGSGDGVRAPEVRVSGGSILFSDDQGASTGKRSGDGITVKAAAEAAGLSEQAFTEAIVGKARLQMVNGELVASVADLRELAEAGTIPTPSKVAAVKQASAETEGKPPTGDPAVENRIANAAAAIGVEPETVRAPETAASDVERRTAGVADTLGVDMGESKPAAPSSQSKPKVQPNGTIVVKASDGKSRRRLGAPPRLRDARRPSLN